MSNHKERDAAAALLHNMMIDEYFFHTCLNCEHWGHERDMCFKYNTRPPAKVIVHSCGEGWEIDLPF